MEHLVLRPNYAKTGPMYCNDAKDQFLEMRAKGISLARIATDLRVSERTLVGWKRQLAPDLRALRAAHLEALHEQTLAPRGSALINTRLQPGAKSPGGLETVSNGFPSPSPVPEPADPRANPSPSSRQHPSAPLPASTAPHGLRLSRGFFALLFCAIPALFLPHFSTPAFHNSLRANHFHIPSCPDRAILLHITGCAKWAPVSHISTAIWLRRAATPRPKALSVSAFCFLLSPARPGRQSAAATPPPRSIAESS